MTPTVVLVPLDVKATSTNSEYIQVIVRVDASVLALDAAMHKARTWLAENVSDSVGVATPEFVIDESLFWRFDLVLALPNEVQPGSGTQVSVGFMRLDAVTGEVENGDALAVELRAHLNSIAP